jgi:hypothetical protein
MSLLKEIPQCSVVGCHGLSKAQVKGRNAHDLQQDVAIQGFDLGEVHYAAHLPLRAAFAANDATPSFKSDCLVWSYERDTRLCVDDSSSTRPKAFALENM